MRIVGSFEAKTHFSRLLTYVSQGEKILITKNGKTIAMLIPAEEPQEAQVTEAFERLRNLREEISSHEITLAEIQMYKEKGRK